MTRPSRRVIVALITVCGIGGLLAIAYTWFNGTGSLIENTLRISLVTVTATLAICAIVLREPRPLVMIAGLAAWSVDTFHPHPALVYGGIALYVGGFYLLGRKLRTPDTTGP